MSPGVGAHCCLPKTAWPPTYGFNNFEVQLGSNINVNTMSLLAEDLEEVGQIISVIGKYVKGVDDNE